MKIQNKKINTVNINNNTNNKIVIGNQIMTETNILTFGQGILILTQIVLFIILYFIYNISFSQTGFKTFNFLTVIIFFSIWVISVTIFQNIVLALNVPISKYANIP